MRKVLLAIVLILALPVYGWAAAETIWVGQNATGNGSGSSSGNLKAIANLTWDANVDTANGVAGPGDTIALSGTFTTGLTVGSSGTSGHPITIDGDINNTGTTAIMGVATTLSLSWSVYSGNIYQATLAYDPQRFYVDGVEQAPAYSLAGASPVGSAMTWYYNPSNTTLYYYHAGGAPSGTFTCPTYYANSLIKGDTKNWIVVKRLKLGWTRATTTACIQLSNTQNWIIDTINGCEGSAGLYGFLYTGNNPTNIEVKNCTIDYKIGWTARAATWTCYTIPGSGRAALFGDSITLWGSSTNVSIHDCSFTDCVHGGVWAESPDPALIITNMRFYNNTVTAPKLRYGRGYGVYDLNPNGTSYIYNNFIYDTCTPDQVCAYNCFIYNNITLKRHYYTMTDHPAANTAGGLGFGNSTLHRGYPPVPPFFAARYCKVYNNTFIDIDGPGLAADTGAAENTPLYYLDFQNNLLYNTALNAACTPAPIRLRYITSSPLIYLTFKNNSVYTTGKTLVVNYRENLSAGTGTNLISIDSFNGQTTGYDSITGNIGTDPQIANPSGSTANDCRLSVGSPAINTGITNSITTDFFGRQRLTKRSIGAIEYWITDGSHQLPGN